MMQQSNVPYKLFFGALFFTASVPYIGYLLTFIPNRLLGFNHTGWAWVIMFIFTLASLFAVIRPRFPIVYWLPVMIYMIGYLIFDYSLMGLQLTLQYILPILVGIVASGFTYDRSRLQFLYSSFGKFLLFIVGMTIYGYLFRPWLPSEAMVPMTLSIGAALYLAVYHQFNKTKYLIFYFGLFIIPLIAVTRMGILVFLVLFVFHFAEIRLSRKIFYGSLGLIIGLIVFFSSKFQEKTFFDKHGELTDISLNIYERGGVTFNSSGRSAFYEALKPGLQEHPLLGNGPRRDNEKLKKFFMGDLAGEAHNDYLSFRYNYGWIGLGLLLFAFIFQFIDLFKIYLQEPMWNRNILISSVLVLHLAFWLFMYSDNILKYTIFFPNFFFAMVGIVYAGYGNVRVCQMTDFNQGVVK